MGILLIIGIICAAVYFICKRSEGHSTPPHLNEGVKAEICEALDQIFLFRNENEFWAKESSLLILQPINQDEKLYAQDSKYIKIQLLLLSPPDDWFFQYIKPKYLNGFNHIFDGTLHYIVKRTHVPYFEMDYDPAMSQLCEYLKAKYSEYEWEYDRGSITVDLKNRCS